MAEGGGLLNRYTLQRRIEGSNPSGSAILLRAFALSRFAGLPPVACAKQDALRSCQFRRSSRFGCEGWISEEGLYVYLLESNSDPARRYVGLSSDLKRRLEAHNAGKSTHTAKYRPWRLVTYVAFSDKAKAEGFERYLKSGSGHAFANKRLW